PSAGDLRGTPYYTFFFQAEDGIRVFHVTGVQTCALPIWSHYCASDFSTTFYVTSHRTTSCFDLTRSNATATSCFQAKITKTNFGATLGQAAVAALHLLAKLCTLWL